MFRSISQGSGASANERCRCKVLPVVIFPTPEKGATNITILRSIPFLADPIKKTRVYSHLPLGVVPVRRLKHANLESATEGKRTGSRGN